MPRTVTRPNMYSPKGRRAIGDMNVTPFIDVLLVLLIMLIMAVPMKVHETVVHLPTDDVCEGCILNPDQNTVFITSADEVLWNGTVVTREQLKQQVAAASALEDQPLLRFEPDANASYNASAHTITTIKDAGAKRFAFVGNHRYAAFDR
ncbi:MAG: biopolymer transporter ExbD [Pseudomonadota bacterium]